MGTTTRENVDAPTPDLSSGPVYTPKRVVSIPLWMEVKEDSFRRRENEKQTSVYVRRTGTWKRELRA